MMFADRDDMPAKTTSERQRYYLERAARVAMKSTMTHKHGAIIVRNDEVISEGFNHHFTHMCHKFSIHAEADAIHKIKKVTHISECELYVVRISKPSMNHCLKYSKPCNDCQRCIERAGIKRTYYSTNQEWEAFIQNVKC